MRTLISWLFLFALTGVVYVFLRFLLKHRDKKTYISNMESEDPQQESTPEEPGGAAPDPKRNSIPQANDSALYDARLNLQDYRHPPLDLLDEPLITDNPDGNKPLFEEQKTHLMEVLSAKGIAIQHITNSIGPSVTLFELTPAPGARISRLRHLETEIAMGLSASGIRMLIPVPHKSTIGIEVYNQDIQILTMRSIMSTSAFENSDATLPVALGRTPTNEDLILDLGGLRHLLIAGATGQGKSNCLHALLISLLYKRHPSELKLVLVDPQGNELGQYAEMERQFLGKLPGQAEAILSDFSSFAPLLISLKIELDNRLELLRATGTKNIHDYNDKFQTKHLSPSSGHQYLPYIVLGMEDFSDFLQQMGPGTDSLLISLLGSAHIESIHIVASTSRLQPETISQELIDCFPARACFQVTSHKDSKRLLYGPGAEHLMGNGDMLFYYDNAITRVQCPFISSAEVQRIMHFIGLQSGYPAAYPLPQVLTGGGESQPEFDIADLDPLFEDAARLVVVNQLGSTSLIQRKMKLGYNRAGYLMDQLQTFGVVGPGIGSRPRDVLMRSEFQLDQFLQDLLIRGRRKKHK